MADNLRRRASASAPLGAAAARAQHTPEPRDAAYEARAAALLAENRGRPQIKPAPAAGNVAAALLRPLLPNKGLGLSELKRRWREIVGDGVAKVSAPEKLAGGVLTIRAPSAVAPFVQHQAPLIVERCRLAGATFSHVRIEQGAPQRQPANVRKVKRAFTAAEEKALEDAMARIDDPALKSALLRLGRAMTRG